MPTVSSKRQVTLPKELCDRLNVNPGDDVDILEYAGKITILKKLKGASAGVLKHVKADVRYTETESLGDTVTKRRRRMKKKKAA